MSKMRSGDQNWYLLPFEARSELMAQHGRSGMKFAGKVSQVITASTGLDDWEWGVTLWARNPLYLKDIVYTMRFDESSARYALFGDFYFGYILPAVRALRGHPPVTDGTGPPPDSEPRAGQHVALPPGAAGEAGGSVPVRRPAVRRERRVSSEGCEPRALAEALARGKADSIAAIEPAATIIGCDQLVSFEGRIFGKPGTLDRAVEQLVAMSGGTHELITALVVRRRGPGPRPHRRHASCRCAG